jgi:Formin Homology 2 Domain
VNWASGLRGSGGRDAACWQRYGRGPLQQVLGKVLAAGNSLNAGTARGNAAALKLDSLLKLADAKVSAAPHHPGPANGGAAGGDDVGEAPAPGFKQPAANGRQGAAASAQVVRRLRNLLDFVAWAVHEAEEEGEGRASQQYLGSQLPALAGAVRRMQSGEGKTAGNCGMSVACWACCGASRHYV